MAEKAQPKVALTAIRKALQGSVPDGGMVGKEVYVERMGHGSCSAHDVRVPDGADAYSGTVRSHETRHLAYSPNDAISDVPDSWNYHPLMRRCVQIAEDCYVETRPIPSNAPQSYHDMHRETMRKDLADLTALDPADPETAKARILMGARARAMQNNYRAGTKKERERDAQSFTDLYDHRTTLHVDHAVDYARDGQRAAAAMRLFKLVGGDESELEPPPPEPGEGKGKESTAEESKMESSKVPGMSEIFGGASTMRIIDLPRTVPTLPDKQPVFRTVYPDSGSRINPSRMVHAMVSGDARGLFIQNLTETHGPSTLLIDASGSMHIDNARLARVCREAPNATVAFYSGNSTEGWLCIYAKNGKRFDGNFDDPPVMRDSDNTVDMQAIKWAMEQRGPITFVTDMGFCGGSQAQVLEAHGLVERLTGSGRMKIIASVREAVKALKA